jgi:putative hydrolase of the HAD superfamily
MTEKQHLIFDADDTLWENNIYFEQAFDEFCEYLNHSTLTPAEIRGVLDEIEIVNARVHGYGAVNFGRNLSQCYLRLAERAVEEHDLKRVAGMAHAILAHELELMEGVAETLPFLAEKHELTMCTKGDPYEQNRKIDLSGLRPLFAHCEVVKEKNRETYENLARVRGFDLQRTWMIGNSPKSDMNPALEAGSNKLFPAIGRTLLINWADFAVSVFILETIPKVIETLSPFSTLKYPICPQRPGRAHRVPNGPR